MFLFYLHRSPPTANYKSEGKSVQLSHLYTIPIYVVSPVPKISQDVVWRIITNATELIVLINNFIINN